MSVAASEPISSPSRSASPSSIAFEELTPTLFIHRPAKLSLTSSHTPVPPKFVVLFGWLNAPLRNVAKYANHYVNKYADEGTTTVIVKLSKGKTFVAKDHIQESVMADLIQLLRDEHAQSEEQLAIARQIPTFNESAAPRGMIVHSFSDGGSTSLAVCLRLLNGKTRARQASQPSNQHVPSYPPLRLAVLDCSPGLTTPASASSGFSMHLRNKNYLGYLYLRVVVFLWVGMEILRDWLLGRRNKSQILRDELNDPSYWGRSECAIRQSGRIISKSDKDSESEVSDWDETDSDRPSLKVQPALPPRLYLYTLADKLIRPEAIEAHALEASRVAGVPTPQPVVKEHQGKPAQGVGKKWLKTIQPSDAGAEGHIRMRRWASPDHCGIAKVDAKGYFEEVDTFLHQML